MAKTYEPIATTTLNSAASSITFSSIPGTYTDLRLVVVCFSVNNSTGYIRLNSDTGTNYSLTYLGGDGSAASSFRYTNNSSGLGLQTGTATEKTPVVWVSDIFSYASTATNKVSLSRASADRNGAGVLENTVSLWRNTSAITSLQIITTIDNFNTGTVATLYGIKAA